MVDAAGVVVDRHPVVRDLAVVRRAVVVRIAVTEEVPGRIDKGVHCLDLTAALFAAARARDADPVFGLRQRRDALGLVVLDLGQQDRQVVLRHRNDAALVAVDDRNRAAPVALARPAPVAQPIAHRRTSAAVCAQPLDDRLRRLLVGQARELRRVDKLAVVVDDDLDRQIEPLRELAVALVVGGDGHDRAGAVVHQDVVGDPDGNARVIDRVRREEAGEDTGLVRPGCTLLCRPRSGLAGVLADLVAVR